MNFYKEEVVQEYHRLHAARYEAMNRKFSRLGGLTGDTMEKLAEILADESDQPEVDSLTQEISLYKSGITDLGIEFYDDWVEVKIEPAFGDTLDVATDKMPKQRQRISNHNEFYKWVSSIKPDEPAKIDFLIKDVMMRQVRSVIYDFDVAGYDNNFLDYWNMCKKVMEKIEALKIQDRSLQREIGYIRTITSLQKKNQLVSFIYRLKGGLLAIDDQSSVDSRDLLSGRLGGLRRRTLVEDGRLALELDYEIRNSVAEQEARTKVWKRIVAIHRQIDDELGKEFSDMCIKSILNIVSFRSPQLSEDEEA